MSEENKKQKTLTDEEMVTSRTVSRRSLLAGAGVAIGSAAIAARSRSALAADKSEGDKDSDKGKDTGKDTDAHGNTDKKKTKIETTRDKD